MSQLLKADPDREQMIAEAAYFRAERRGFTGGDPLADWLEAEAEITARFAAMPARVARTTRGGQRKKTGVPAEKRKRGKS